MWVDFEFTDGAVPEHNYPKVSLAQRQSQFGKTAILARATFSALYPAEIDLEKTKIVFYAWGGQQTPAQPYLFSPNAENQSTKIFLPVVTRE